MVSVIIMDNGESNVIQLTFENLYRELKDIYGSELLIKKDWFDITDIKNRYVCFVESDCLVQPGYFKFMLEKFKEKGYSRSMAIMGSAVSVNYWQSQIFGYSFDKTHGVIPNTKAKSSSPYNVQITFIPGSIIRVSMLKTVIKGLAYSGTNLVEMSADVSMALWERSIDSQGKAYRVCLNPKASYLTTEDYVNDICDFHPAIQQPVAELFIRESI